MNEIEGTNSTESRTAFVLGGGGGLGGYQAGMLQALFEAGVKPDLVLGTSIGSLQGAIVASNPTLSCCLELARFWMDFVGQKVMSPTMSGFLGNVKERRAGITSNERLRSFIADYIDEDMTFADLKIPFECVASSIEHATARYFGSGPIIPALLASGCVPGLWPPVRIDGEHYFDGGLIDSVPVGRAASLGATTVYVLPLRQSDTPLVVPKLPWELASIAFEVSRRAQVQAEISRPRPGVDVHVLPSGESAVESTKTTMWATSKRDMGTVRRRISAGYESAQRYLEENPPTRAKAMGGATDRPSQGDGVAPAA